MFFVSYKNRITEISAGKIGTLFWGNYRIGDSARDILSKLFNIDLERFLELNTRPETYGAGGYGALLGENNFSDSHGSFVIYSQNPSFPGRDPNNETYLLKFTATNGNVLEMYISESKMIIESLSMYNRSY